MFPLLIFKSIIFSTGSRKEFWNCFGGCRSARHGERLADNFYGSCDSESCSFIEASCCEWITIISDWLDISDYRPHCRLDQGFNVGLHAHASFFERFLVFNYNFMDHRDLFYEIESKKISKKGSSDQTADRLNLYSYCICIKMKIYI